MRFDRIILSIFITICIGIYTVMVFQFLATEGESRFLTMFFITAPAVVLLLIFPKAALIVLAIQVFLVRWLYDLDIMPREATWLTDVIILLIAGRGLFLMPWRKEKAFVIEKFVFLLFGFAVLSTIINGS
ncbi:MAG: hypothetical protein ACOZB3_07170, partial [Calditrichota bacterium]